MTAGAETPTLASAERLWFLDTLVTVHVPHENGADGMALLESAAPFADSPRPSLGAA